MLTRRFALVLILAASSWSTDLAAQIDDLAPRSPSAKKALGLSLLVPGLGHRYANGGHWGKTGSFFLAADVGILLNLVGARWREGDLENSYRTLASARAGADLEGKNRSFFLSLGLYNSSEEFTEVLLRTRQWDRLEGAEDPNNYWQWTSEEDRNQYRELRDDAESMGRRTSWLIGALVANRLISGVTAMLRTRGGGGTEMSARIVPNAAYSAPVAQLSIRW